MSRIAVGASAGQFSPHAVRRASLRQELAALNVPTLPDHTVAEYCRAQMKGRSLGEYLLLRLFGHLSLAKFAIKRVTRVRGSTLLVVFLWFAAVFCVGFAGVDSAMSGSWMAVPELAFAFDGMLLVVLGFRFSGNPDYARRADRWKRRPVRSGEVRTENQPLIVPERLMRRAWLAGMIEGVRIEALVIDEDPILLAVRGRLWWSQAVPIGAWDTGDSFLDSF